METYHVKFRLIGVLLSLGVFAGTIWSAVTDTAEVLYVPAGETYSLHGSRSYSQSVVIEGTLYVTKYNGTDPTGTVTLAAPSIDISGMIDGNGRGFRGEGNYQEPVVGVGGYPSGGGGYGGIGGSRHGYSNGGTTYGMVDGQTIEKGAGGGDTGGALYGGGNGGAAVTLQGGSIAISGTIAVNGTAGLDTTFGAGGASGGGILIIGEVVDISGTLTANGGRGGNGSYGGGGGGGGRVKVFYGIFNNAATVTTHGGAGGTGTYPGSAGQGGTYYTEQILLDNGDYLIIPQNVIYTMNGTHTYNKLVGIYGTLDVAAYGGTEDTGSIELNCPEIQVQTSGLINADAKGYRSLEGPGTGTPVDGGSGAGYGGRGGNSGHGGTGGPTYGSEDEAAIEMGSGGAGTNYLGSIPGGRGGGKVVLRGDYIDMAGTITANGGNGSNYTWAAGGGSGGGIMLQSGTVYVSGALSAKGGNGGSGTWSGGSGGGGRIKIFYACNLDTTNATVTVAGGPTIGGTYVGQAGQGGTYYSESDWATPYRGYESTLQRWDFFDNNPNPTPNVVDNPYGMPLLNVAPIGSWLPVWGGREGVWPCTGIHMQIPNRPGSGPDSLKLVWLQVTWAPYLPDFLTAEPIAMELGGLYPRPSAKYQDCVLDAFTEGDVSGNWKNTVFVFTLKPNPEDETLVIEGPPFAIDRVTVETICIPGLRTGDMNGDYQVDLADFAIFASHWLDGVE